MDGGREIPNIPARPDEGEPGIRVGVDDWVATHEQRHEHRGGPVGRIQRELERAPRPAFYAAFGIAAALLPAFTSNGYIIRVGFDTLIYMLLCLGLNVVVGYAGLLDLGYVAFYGTGAYIFAMLASPKFGLHWDTLFVVPIAVVLTGLLGLLVALPSRGGLAKQCVAIGRRYHKGVTVTASVGGFVPKVQTPFRGRRAEHDRGRLTRKIHLLRDAAGRCGG